MQDGAPLVEDRTSAGAGVPGPDAEPLDLAAFFLGRVRAHGIFEDRFGRMRRRFVIDMFGVPDGAGGIAVDETLTYDDGTVESRAWTLSPTDGSTGRYRLWGEDFVGVVDGRAHGPTAEMSYVYRLRMGGRIVPVRMRDRLHRLSDSRVINRLTMRKFGIRLGDVSACFERV